MPDGRAPETPAGVESVRHPRAAAPTGRRGPHPPDAPARIHPAIGTAAPFGTPGPHPGPRCTDLRPMRPADPSTEPTLRRRQLLAAGGSVGAAAFLAVGGRAGAATGTMTVWKLSPDWGTPRGPHGKTHLHSNASRRAAANRFALTRADAEAMNLHKCSFAPAVPVTVDAAAFLALWGAAASPWTSPWSGTTVRLLDLRRARRIEGGDDLVNRALEPASPARPAEPGGGGSGVGPGSTPAAPADRVATNSPDRSGPRVGGRQLALTGTRPGELVALGLGALAAGATAVRVRRGGDAERS